MRQIKEWEDHLITTQGHALSFRLSVLTIDSAIRVGYNLQGHDVVMYSSSTTVNELWDGLDYALNCGTKNFKIILDTQERKSYTGLRLMEFKDGELINTRLVPFKRSR